MKFSICIPHHNRVAYLFKVLESIEAQDYENVEVVISDDCSTDDSEARLRAYASSPDLRIRCRYIRQERNLGYDCNLRTALMHADGDYLFLLGNDDALADPSVLTRLSSTLQALGRPAVAYTNTCAYANRSEVYSRAKETKVLGSGPAVALKHFRKFSVVCGLIFRADAAKRFDTAKFDGSVYYQIYLGCAAVASGGQLASIQDAAVAKDVVLDGKIANSYRDVLRVQNLKFKRATGALDAVGHVACAGILPHAGAHDRRKLMVAIFLQLLLYSYPYWLYDYRRLGVPKASVNLMLGCTPGHLTRLDGASVVVALELYPAYLAASILGLLAPLGLLDHLAATVRRLKA